MSTIPTPTPGQARVYVNALRPDDRAVLHALARGESPETVWSAIRLHSIGLVVGRKGDTGIELTEKGRILCEVLGWPESEDPTTPPVTPPEEPRT